MKTRGFVCPGCPGDPVLHVTYTRKLTNGTIVRYRRCAVCGSRAKTVERLIPAKMPKKVTRSSTRINK